MNFPLPGSTHTHLPVDKSHLESELVGSFYCLLGAFLSFPNFLQWSLTFVYNINLLIRIYQKYQIIYNNSNNNKQIFEHLPCAQEDPKCFMLITPINLHFADEENGDQRVK